MSGDGRVSIVIPHLNQPDWLENCLASLKEQSRVDLIREIIVVDNGSTGGLAPLEARFTDVRWLAEPNPGPGLARNLGIAHATGDIIALIDADCRAHPRWIETLTARLDRESRDIIVGGDVRIDFADPHRATPVEAYEAVFAYRMAFYVRKFGFSGTGNLAFRRPVHALVGPFAGIHAAEDRDWGQRAGKIGIPTVHEAGMIAYHPARPDLAALKLKWLRHIGHDLEKHRAGGGSRLAWTVRAAAVLLSAFAHTPMLLLSPRLEGRSGRLGGLGILYATRLFRAGEMLRQARSSANAATSWNRKAGQP